jgi:leucyl aminopeptidase
MISPRNSAVSLALSVVLVSTGFAQTAPPVRGAVDLQVVAGQATEPADVLAILVPQGFEPASALPREAGPEVARALRSAIRQKAFTGAPLTHLSVFEPGGLGVSRLILVGVSAEAEWSAETVRRAAGYLLRQLGAQAVSTLTVAVPALNRGTTASNSNLAAAIVEGALLGAFDPGIHKSGERAGSVKTLRLAGLGTEAELRPSIAAALTAAKATNFARTLAVEPANFKSPETIAEHARAIARETGLEVTVYDEKQMAEMGMGGILAVGKGALNPPRFIALRYRPASGATATKLALIGKGVVFDSGGISLKDAANMYRMKGDMAGGAAVLAAMRIVAGTKPAIEVLGIMPTVENMPSGSAQKPGDVFRNLSGKTVEVLSTDAEGRMILSDGVSWAIRQGATHVATIATLTGSVATALGNVHAGAFASDEALMGALSRATAFTGESAWRLPLDDEYGRVIKKSLVADLNESAGGGGAGASIGAKFIQQFAEGRAFLHLDIAGVSWPDDVPWRAPGPSGWGARTLARLPHELAAAPSR